MDKLNILIMSGDWQGALACVQSLGRRGHRIFLGHTGIDRHAFRSGFVTGIEGLADTGDMAADAARLLDVAQKRRIDLVIPISDRDVSVVATARDLAPDAMVYPVPPLHVIEQARDRNRAQAAFAAAGLPVPCAIGGTAECIRTDWPKVALPAYLKRSYTQASMGVQRVTTQFELAQALECIPQNERVQLQQEIPHARYVCVTAVCRNGEILEHFSFCGDALVALAGTLPLAFALSLTKGSAHLVALARLFKMLNWTGAISVDGLETDDGRIVAIEINPRLSGTTNFALNAGRDLPSQYLVLAGHDPGPPMFARRDLGGFLSLEEHMRFRLAQPRGSLGWLDRQLADLKAGGAIGDNSYRDDRGYWRSLCLKLWELRWDLFKKRVLRF